MHFFDCNVYFGLPTLKPLIPVPQVTDLLAEMQQCGVERALTWHIMQHDTAPQAGNAALAEAIAGRPELTGCWAILPNQTHELPPPDEFMRQMGAARVRAVRAFGWAQKYLLNSVALGDWLEAFDARRIPLMLSRVMGLPGPRFIPSSKISRTWYAWCAIMVVGEKTAFSAPWWRNMHMSISTPPNTCWMGASRHL